MNIKNVNYGCGANAPEGWLNFDASPRVLLENTIILGDMYSRLGGRRFPKNVMYGDIVKGLPLDSGTVDLVFCSHVLEHLTREGGVRALTETHRILKSGGTFRIVVPDLKWRAERYLQDLQRMCTQSSTIFMRSTMLGENSEPTRVLGSLQDLFSKSKHKWMYDELSLEESLKSVGFISVRRCAFGDSTFKAFEKVEDVDRFYEDRYPELAMEAIKA